MIRNQAGPLTIQEAKTLQVGDTIYSLRGHNKEGVPHKVKVTGNVKTWKKHPDRVEVPVLSGGYKVSLTAEVLHVWTLNEQHAIAAGKGK